MDGSRRKFKREGEAQRQGDLIAAALELIAEGGQTAATVRAIAARAGVTPGLIRHYFKSREDLLAAAYATFAARVAEAHLAEPPGCGPDPVGRLASFVNQALMPAQTEGTWIGQWAGFLHLIQRESGLRVQHRQLCHTVRDEIEGLIRAALAAAGRPAEPAELRRLAICCHALIDGLWLEGSVRPEDFAPGELPRLGVEAAGRLIGLPLLEFIGGMA